MRIKKSIAIALSILAATSCISIDAIAENDETSTVNRQVEIVYDNDTTDGMVIDDVELEEQRQEFLDEFSSFDITRMSSLPPDDPDFWFEFEEHSKPTLKGYDASAVISPDDLVVEDAMSSKIERPSAQPLTNSSTQYEVHNGSSVTTVPKLFDAINKATVSNAYVKETNTTKTVFTRDNSENSTYKFQYTNYYDNYDATSRTADEWVNDFRYAHVIDGTGELIANSYYKVGGITPPSHALEPQSGSYYYKISNDYTGKSTSVTVNLTGANYMFNIPKQNAYIYTAAQTNNATVELGIMSCRESLGKWWHYSTNPQNIHKIKAYKNRIALSPSTSDNTNYKYTMTSASAKTVDIGISLSNTTGKLTGYVGSWQYTEDDLVGDSTFSSSKRCSFMHAVSMPEDVAEGRVANLRCGSYIKNVKLNNCKLYSNIGFAGNDYDFYPNTSSTINTAFIYCDDTIQHYRTNATTEQINIDYSIGYKQ